MNRTWKPIVAGIIDIAVSAAITGYVVNGIISTGSLGWLIYLVFAAITLAAGAAAILRRVWLLALIGSIFASPPGIVSFILVALSRDEFK